MTLESLITILHIARILFADLLIIRGLCLTLLDIIVLRYDALMRFSNIRAGTLPDLYQLLAFFFFKLIIYIVVCR